MLSLHRTRTLFSLPSAYKKVQLFRVNSSNFVITCKSKKFDLQKPNPNAVKFGSIELASQGWKHHRAKGDFFSIRSVADSNIGHEPSSSFESFGLDERIIKNLQSYFGAIRPCSNIQSSALQPILSGQHTLIAAETGCGKTLAFLLPIIQQILNVKSRQLHTNANCVKEEKYTNSPISLVLTPGRELASQIGSVAEQLCKGLDITVKVILGGQTKQKMLNPDINSVDLMVGTVGATSKLFTAGIYHTNRCEHVILDEVDTLLDDSFNAKMKHLLRRFQFHKQMSSNIGSVWKTQLILVSATMPTNLDDILQTIIDPNTVCKVIGQELHCISRRVKQDFIRMCKMNRPIELLKIARNELARRRPVIVFSNKSATSDYVSMFLNENGIECLNLNGDMPASIRSGKFSSFQNGDVNIISTTDIASRGLDTIRARHVVNFDFPLHMADYIHRIGRIGRLGCGSSEIYSVTNFVTNVREIDIVQQIEHTARSQNGILPKVNANITNIIKNNILMNLNDIQ